MDSLPKDVLIKLLTTIQNPKEMSDKELDINIHKCIQEKLNRNLEKVTEEIKNLKEFLKYDIKITSLFVEIFNNSIRYCVSFSDVYVNIIRTGDYITGLCVWMKENENPVIKHQGGKYSKFLDNKIENDDFRKYDDFLNELNNKGYFSKLVKFM